MQRDEHGRFKKQERDYETGDLWDKFFFYAKLLLLFTVILPWLNVVIRGHGASEITKLLTGALLGNSKSSSINVDEDSKIPYELKHWIGRTEEVIRDEVMRDIARFEAEKRQAKKNEELRKKELEVEVLIQNELKEKQDSEKKVKGFIDMITGLIQNTDLSSLVTSSNKKADDFNYASPDQKIKENPYKGG